MHAWCCSQSYTAVSRGHGAGRHACLKGTTMSAAPLGEDGTASEAATTAEGMQAPPCRLALPAACTAHLPNGGIIPIQEIVACKAKAPNEKHFTLHSTVCAVLLESSLLHPEHWACLLLPYVTTDKQHDCRVASGHQWCSSI